MKRPPDLFTPLEEKRIAEMIESQIDFLIEQEHIHEVIKDDLEDVA